MGDLLGFATFRAFGAARLVAVLAVIWAGLVAVPSAEATDAVLVAAGDIADCSSVGDTATAALVGATAGTVVTLGDNVYGRATAREFANCYGPTWGRFKARTKPSLGNHDYAAPGAGGYFDYFGAAAGPRGKGWYSYEAGGWNVVVLNSNCAEVACGKGSEQERWLRAELAAQSNQCTVAYFHHPRFSSDARHGNNAAVGPLWEALYDYGADLVLSGHAHDYERFAPQNPAGVADPAFGIRQIVVGTGGRGHYGFGGIKPNSQVRNATALGVLKLTLRPGSYDWSFLPQAGKTFTDSGTGACHGRPPTPPTTTTTTTVTGPGVSSSTTTTTKAPVSTSTTSTTGPAAGSSSTTTTRRPAASSTTTATTRPAVGSSSTTTTRRPTASSSTTTFRPVAASSTTTTRKSTSSSSTTTRKSTSSSTTTTRKVNSSSTTTTLGYYG